MREGRQPGYQVSHDIKVKTRLNNPYRRRVQDPTGRVFDSILECAQHYNLKNATITYYCNQGERQRKHGLHSIHARRDFRGWMFLDERVLKTRERKVQTPHGIFDSVSEAAKSEGVTSAAICHKLKRGKEYYYVDPL